MILQSESLLVAWEDRLFLEDEVVTSRSFGGDESSRLDGDLSLGTDFPESDFLEEVRFAFGDFDFAAIREDEDLSRPRLGDDSVFPDDRWDFFMEEEEDFFLGEEEL